MSKSKLANKSQIRQAVNTLNEAIKDKVKSTAQYQAQRKIKKSIEEQMWKIQDQLRDLLDQQRKLQQQEFDLGHPLQREDQKLFRLIFDQQQKRKPEIDKLANDATMEIINLQQLNEAVASFKP